MHLPTGSMASQQWSGASSRATFRRECSLSWRMMCIWRGVSCLHGSFVCVRSLLWGWSMRYACTDRVYGVTAVVGSLLARSMTGVLTDLAHGVLEGGRDGGLLCACIFVFGRWCVWCGVGGHSITCPYALYVLSLKDRLSLHCCGSKPWQTRTPPPYTHTHTHTPNTHTHTNAHTHPHTHMRRNAPVCGSEAGRRGTCVCVRVHVSFPHHDRYGASVIVFLFVLCSFFVCLFCQER